MLALFIIIITLLLLLFIIIILVLVKTCMLDHVEPFTSTFDAECFQAKVTVGLTALGMLQADEGLLLATMEAD